MEFELQATFDQIQLALENGQLEVVEDVVNVLHPADLEVVLHHMDHDSRIQICGLLTLEPLAELLGEAEETLQREILETLDDARISRVIEVLPSDEAADLVGVLPEERVGPVLARTAREDSEEVRQLLRYDEETAGGIMEAEVLSVPETAVVAEAIDLIREAVAEDRRVYSVYVVDAEEKPLGQLLLERLLLAKPVLPVTEVMEPARSIPAEMDQEDVARVVGKYDLTAVPVVDKVGKLVGQVTVDDVVDVLEEEATEDFSKMAGAGGEEIHEPSAVRVSGVRLPWLIVGLAGGLITARIMSVFEVSLATMISIAFFLPVMTAMAGNVAIQSSAIVIRGLATGEVSLLGLRRRLLRELRISVITGIVCGGLLAGTAVIWRGDVYLSLLLGLSMLGVILLATTVGALIPLMLKRLGMDPAIAMGPIVTTWNDITSVVIYLALATVFLHWLR